MLSEHLLQAVPLPARVYLAVVGVRLVAPHLGGLLVEPVALQDVDHLGGGTADLERLGGRRLALDPLPRLEGRRLALDPLKLRRRPRHHTDEKCETSFCQKVFGRHYNVK